MRLTPMRTKPLSDLSKRVKARLKALRLERGFTQEQVCERAEISLDAVTRIEGGTRVPSIDTLNSLANALGTSIGELTSSAPIKPKKPAPPLARLVSFLEGEPREVQEGVAEVAKAFVRALRANRT